MGAEGLPKSICEGGHERYETVSISHPPSRSGEAGFALAASTIKATL